MIKHTIYCDCCGDEMKENTGAELKGQLRAKNIQRTEEGGMDLPEVELNDICDDCACQLHLTISALCTGRTVKRVAT
jgi:hypothetical protein